MARTSIVGLASALLSLGLAGCVTFESRSDEFVCEQQSDCTSPRVCQMGYCVLGEIADASRIDANLDRPDANTPQPDGNPVLPDASTPLPDAEVDNTHFININGPSLTGVDYPGAWTADIGNGGVCTGTNRTVNGNVSGTVDDDLFRGSVFTTGGQNLLCTIPGIPNGSYKLTLLFAETFFGTGCGGGGGVGSRVFDIRAEGALLEADVDIYAEGGCVSGGPAGSPVTREFTVTVAGGALEIELDTAGDAMISAISIE